MDMIHHPEEEVARKEIEIGKKALKRKVDKLARYTI